MEVPIIMPEYPDTITESSFVMTIRKLLISLKRCRWPFLLFITVFILASYCEIDYSNKVYSERDIKKFEKILTSKEIKAESLLAELQKGLTETGDSFIFSRMAEEYAKMYFDEGIAFFIYNRDSLIIWNSNSMPVPERPDIFKESDIIKLYNFWFLTKSLSYDDYSLIALILIRSEFPYENKVLKEGFQEKFNLSNDVKIIFPGNRSENPVFNKEGSLLFSLDFSFATMESKYKSSICVSLYFLCFFLFLTLLRRFIKISPKELKNYVFPFIILILIVFYSLVQYYRFPAIIFNLDLFSPHKFARSSFLPSLGNLLLITVSGFFIIYNFYLEVFFNREQLSKYKIYRYSLIFIMGISALILFYTNIALLRSLIIDSSISFETYKVLEISIYTFIGFLIIGLVFASYAILLDKIFGMLLRLKFYKEALVFLLLLNIVAIIIYFIPDAEISHESALFFILLTVLIYYFKIIRNLKYRISTYLIFILLFSVYTALQVFRSTEQRYISDLKIMAVNLSAEHDPVAELLFVDTSDKIRNDNELETLLFAPVIDFKAIYSEIQRKYFSGYWDKYDLQVTLCGPDDRVYVNPPDDQWAHCYSFFYEVVMKNAIEVPNSDFFFLDNLNGRISYFTAVSYYHDKREITVFIELDSRLLSEGLGYPELLLDENLQKNTKNNYSYAKYNNGRLITSSGSYPYRMTSTSYTDGAIGFELNKSEGFDHVIYNIDGNNTIIVTKPSFLYIDMLISFSYVFVFYFVLLIILLLLTNLSPLLTNIEWNFKNKIQVTMSTVIFISVLLIGTGTVYFSIRQYRSRQIENLREKVQSIYIELTQMLEFEQDLQSWASDNYYNLELLLQKFSNVFYTDINLYDEKGWLLASSRPEVFDTGLIGRQLNAIAFVEMITNQRSEFIHSETIGELNYLSAYIPFVNSENKLLAYLNLPYFTRQDELTMEIANLVVTIINILVLLTLLSLTFAVIISNKITQPLRLIQEHISRFSLNQHNEKIKYKGKDEIGSLINEYNLMIDQLTESAERLARSEREMAWREMAKQIAHEIKNPLTPMRLILQHLQRSWKEDPEIREHQQEKLSKILIEQIDNLSKIASEFSNFAKMPLARNEKVDLTSVVNDVAKLFGKTENIKIIVKAGTTKEIFIWADKEQISRVFINLVKNAIQSVPEGKNGKIEIIMDKTDAKAIIKVKDDGKGIPEEIRDKLFQPNFTTKSSGMGMGLAIAKNIISTSGGDINYETQLNKGSIFIVELPLLFE